MSNLASRLAEGEQAAWAELYDATADSLFHYVRSLAGHRDAAADILQESFIRLFRSRERLRGVDDLDAFVFTVTRNETNRWLSKKGYPLQNAQSLDESIATHSGHSQQDDSEFLQHALSQLSAENREIIHLKIYANFTFAQIAEILQIPAGTCASRYRRSLMKIKSTIQEHIR